MYPPQNIDVFTPTSGSGKNAVAEILPTVICASDIMTPTTYAFLDALSGITSRMTPTLTPSTLRSIEESLQLVDSGDSEKPIHHRDAGFVPPSAPTSSVQTVSSKKQQVVYIVSERKEGVTRDSSRRLSVSSNSSCSSDATTYTKKGRRCGGRRKEDFEKESLLPLEEQERRRLRRERNKQAAARCRKRRVDLTSSLEQETDELEDKKLSLQKEIRQLLQEKDELEAVLRDHSSHCKVPKLERSVESTETSSHVHLLIKREADDSNDSYHSEDADPDSIEKFVKPVPPLLSRPTSLPVAPLYSPRVKKPFEIAGVAITTPSSVIPGFSFDSLVEGVTGFTPIASSPSPSCATQQRSFLLPVDLSSPESANRKLVL